ncbi:MAG: hypothetical protein JXM73_21550 [Anaerolineae bacterium]|nr:hypothetical protein [Anaerolineae bacterium]
MKSKQMLTTAHMGVTVALFVISVLILLTSLALADAQSNAPQSAQAAHADPLQGMGTAFTYQGRLDQDGRGVTAMCDLAFRLYDEAAEGNQVGSPITTTVAITEGLFTTGLDFGDGAFSGDARWLQIAVQCPGDAAFTTLPRQALTAVPYAMYAQAAPWSGIAGMPAGFADGVDDNTTYTAGTGILLQGTTLSVDPKAFQRRVFGACDSGYAIREITEGGTISCELTYNGDITRVSPGFGLDGGGDIGDVTLSVNPVEVQVRITDTCPSGSSIRAINEHGLVTCQADANNEYVAGNQLELAGASNNVFNVLEGPDSGLDADTLDGESSAAFHNASFLDAGTLAYNLFSAYGDLGNEGYLDNSGPSDLLTQDQSDGRYVNEAQANSISSAMIVEGTVTSGDLQDGAALTEILDDDGSGSLLDADTLDGLTSADFVSSLSLDGYFNLSEDEQVLGSPSFKGDVIFTNQGSATFNGPVALNGGSGAVAPFTVDSSYKVTDLNCDWLDDYTSADFATQANLTSYFKLSDNETVTGSPTFDGAVTFNNTVALNGGTTGSTAPFTVDSTFKVTSLNCDLLDGKTESDFATQTDLASYFKLSDNETVTGRPAFNGGDTSNSPFTVDSSFLVTNLNSDKLDGNDATAFVFAGSARLSSYSSRVCKGVEGCTDKYPTDTDDMISISAGFCYLAKVSMDGLDQDQLGACTISNNGSVWQLTASSTSDGSKQDVQCTAYCYDWTP